MNFKFYLYNFNNLSRRGCRVSTDPFLEISLILTDDISESLFCIEMNAIWYFKWEDIPKNKTMLVDNVINEMLLK